MLQIFVYNAIYFVNITLIPQNVGYKWNNFYVGVFSYFGGFLLVDWVMKFELQFLLAIYLLFIFQSPITRLQSSKNTYSAWRLNVPLAANISLTEISEFSTVFSSQFLKISQKS